MSMDHQLGSDPGHSGTRRSRRGNQWRDTIYRITIVRFVSPRKPSLLCFGTCVLDRFPVPCSVTTCNARLANYILMLQCIQLNCFSFYKKLALKGTIPESWPQNNKARINTRWITAISSSPNPTRKIHSK